MKKLFTITLMLLAQIVAFASAEVSIENKTGAVPGAGLSVAVNADFSTVDPGVSAFTLYISYDNRVLDSPTLQNQAFSGIQSSTNSSGNTTTITVLWSDNGVVSQLDGKLFDLNFNYKGGNTNLTFSGCSVGDASANLLTGTFNNGSVTQVDIIPGISVNNGTLYESLPYRTIDVPVYGHQLYDIGGFELELNFDQIVFTGNVTVVNRRNDLVSRGTWTASYLSGKVLVAWTKSSTDNVSIPEGAKLFDLRMSYTYGPASIAFAGTSQIAQNVIDWPAFTNDYFTNGSIGTTKANPTLTLPTAAGITYGQTLSNATLSGGSASYTGAPNSGVVEGTFSYQSPSTIPNAGTYAATVVFTPTNTTAYNVVTGSVNVEVAKKGLTVTAENKSKTYDGSAFSPFTALYDGFIAGETATVLGGTLAFTTSPVNPAINAGTYSIAPSGLSSTNYSFSYVAGTLTINKATPTATLAVSNTPVTYNASAQTATVAITVSSVPGAVANIGNGTHTNAGTYAVTADFVPTDGDNYNTLTGLSAGNFVINKASQSITWSNPANILVGTALGATQLNAIVSGVAGGSAPGALTYDPAAGILLPVGDNQALNVTAAATLNYTEATATVYINVLANTANISLTGGTFTFDGTGHAATGFAYGIGGVGDVLSPALTFSYVGTGSTTYGPTTTAPVNAGAYEVTGSFAGNATYAANSATVAITILPKAITITPTAGQTKVYGEADPVFLYTSTPLEGMDSFTGSLGREPGETVLGSSYDYTLNNLSAGTNYTLSMVADPATFSITKRPLTLTADDKTKTYGNNDPVFTVTWNGFAFDDDPADLTGTYVIWREVGEDVGVYEIRIINLLSSDNYTITEVYGDITIGSRIITVINAVADNKTYDGTVAATISGGDLQNIANSDVISIGNRTGAFDQANVGTDIHVTASLTLVGAKASNYTLVQPDDLKADILAKQINVTAGAKSKTYGSNDPALTYTYTPELIGTDAFSGSLSRVAGENVGDYDILKNNLSLSPNYSIFYTGAKLTINQLNVAVAADAKSKVYGQTDPEFTFVSNPAVGSLLDNSIAIAFTGNLSRETGETVGSYGILQGTLANGNYAITFTSADLTITQKELTGSFTVADKVYDGTTEATITGRSLTGLLPADAAKVALLNGTAAFASKNTGTHAVTASAMTIGAGADGNLSANYVLVGVNDASATIQAKLLDITQPSIATREYDGTTDPATVTSGTLSGFVSPETVVVTDATAANYNSANAGTYDNVAIVYTLGNGENGGLASNYTLANGSALAVVSPKVLTIGAPSIASRVYDGTTNPGSLSLGILSGFVGAETLNINGSAANYSGKDVGQYTVAVSYTLLNGENGGLATNYSLANGSATGEIITRPLTANSSVNSKTYDGSPATGTVVLGSIHNLVGLETLNITASAADFSNENVGTDKATTISYILADGDNGGLATNYSMAPLSSKGDITARELTLSNFAAGNKVYDGNTNVLSGLGFDDNRLAGDNLTFAYSVAFSDKNVGVDKDVNYTNISISGGADVNNYSLVTTSGTAQADITVRTLNFSNFVADAKMYDGNTTATGAGFDDDRVGGDGLTFSFDAAFADKHAGIAKPVNFTNLAISGGSDQNNYVLAANTGTATAAIGKRPVKVVVNTGQTKVYGNADPLPFGYTTSADAGFYPLATNDAFAGALERAAGENIGFYSINQGNLVINDNDGSGLNMAGNYAITFVAANFEITRRELTMVLDNKSKIYGNIDPVFTITWLGLANNDSPSVVTGTYIIYRIGGENVGTYTIDVFGTPQAANYTIVKQTGIFTINPRQLTISGAAADDKDYDGTTLAHISGGSLVNILGSDNVTINGRTGTFAQADAGTDIAVVANLTLGGTAAGNYTLLQPAGLTADIFKVNQTIDWATPAAIVYGTLLSDTQLNAVATGIAGGSAPGALTYSPASDAMLNAGTDQVLTVNAAATNNYNAASKTVLITVNKAEQNISWSNPANVPYGTLLGNTQLNAVVTGVAGGSQTGAVTYSPAADALLGAGTHTLTVNVDATDNYKAATSTVEITVEKIDQTIVWSNPANIIYGTLLSATQLNATVSGVSGGSVPGSLTYSPAAGTLLAAGSHTLTVTAASTADYNETTFDVTIVVEKADQNIAWSNPADIVYGTRLSDTQLNAVVSGVAGGSATGIATYLPAANTLLDAGSHTLTVNLAATDNYNAANANVTLVVTKASQTISWATPAAVTYGTLLSDTQLNATVAGAADPGASAPGSLTYTPAAGTMLGAGTHTLSVSAAATDNYNEATATVDILVNKADQTISWSAPANITYGTLLSATQLNATVSGVAGGSATGALDYSPASGSLLAVGTHNLQVTAASTANYNAANASVSITVDQLVITVQAVAKTKVYGESDPTLTYTYAPELIGADVFSGDIVRVAGEDVDIYDINQGTLSLHSNYLLSYNPANFTITERPIMITANNRSKTYGNVLDLGTSQFVVTGVMAFGESVTSVNLLSTGTVFNAFAGNYAIVPSNATGSNGFDPTNYNISYVNGVLTVNPFELTLSNFAASPKVYDGTTTVTGTGFLDNRIIPSDNISYSFGVAFEDANVGLNKEVLYSNIAITGGTHGVNYSLPVNSGTAYATISAKALTIIPNDITKTYNTTYVFTGNEFVASGIVAGESIASVSLSSAGAGASALPGDYDILAANAIAGGSTALSNYNITYAVGTLTVGPAQNADLSAFVKYSKVGSADAPMSGVTVELLDVNSNVLYTSITDVTGKFSFTNVPVADIAALRTNVNSSLYCWAGVNATDAMVIQNHLVGNSPSYWQPVNFINHVADVTGNGTVTNSDPLALRYRVLYPENPAYVFPSGDWAFNANSTNFVNTGTTTAVLNAPVVANQLSDISVRLFGDVNGSYIPCSSKRLLEPVLTDDVMYVQQGDEFELPFRINTNANLGAMTIYMAYNPDLVEIIDIQSNLSDLYFSIDQSMLRIFWTNPAGNTFNANDQLFKLVMKTIATVQPDMTLFYLDSQTEFADPEAMLVNAGLITYGVDNVNVGLADQFEKQIMLNAYPNPFSDKTDIVYELPVDADVTMSLLNLQGVEIVRLVNEYQNTGAYKVSAAAVLHNMKPGVYMIQLQLQAAGKNYSKHLRVVVIR